MKTNNNIILITGGGSGLGLELAKQLYSLNNKILICGKDRSELNRVKELLPNISIFKCDLTRDEEINSLVESIKNEFPEINILINNAGVGYKYDFITDDNALDKTVEEIQVNYLAYVKLIRLFLPILTLKSNAAIVNINTGLAFVPMSSLPTYSASKSAMHFFSRSFRHQLKNNNSKIKLFEVLPPVMDIKLAKDIHFYKLKPEKVASIIVKGLQRDRYFMPIGISRILSFSKNFMAGFIEWYLNKI